MDFPESIKLEAKRKAHFACVWCRRTEFFLEVHHIIAQEAGGPSTLENAAPLCPQCHTHIGPNPDMRKQLKERRDWWWAECERRAMPVFKVNVEQTNAMVERLKGLEAAGQRSEALLGELKNIILNADDAWRAAVSSARTAHEIVQASSSGRTITPDPVKLTLSVLPPTVVSSTSSRPPKPK